MSVSILCNFAMNSVSAAWSKRLLQGRVFSSALRNRLSLAMKAEFVSQPLAPILHPSPWRLRCLGLFTLVGHPLFGWIWSEWQPQPYENMWLRCAIGLLGLPLLTNRFANDPNDRYTRRIFSFAAWAQLPLFFSWMYWMNDGNSVWLASMAAMLVIYYHLTDWRLASIGVVTGSLLGWLLARVTAIHPFEQANTVTPLVVLGFAWTSAILLGLSSANLRREHLNHTLTTIGIMAHELRTPLATMALIGDAVRDEARLAGNEQGRQKLDMLALRLHGLVRNMNHQIDTQITNARLLRLPYRRDSVSAADLVREVIKNYPYRSSRERDCVELLVRKDFRFESSAVLFSQVVDNLMKNAMRSLAAGSSSLQTGDLRLEVGVLHNRGRVVVTDRGIGIDSRLQARIFEPFFSTDRGTGHGLGLAFCLRVIHSAGGTIRVKSEPGRGAIFTIELPLTR